MTSRRWLLLDADRSRAAKLNKLLIGWSNYFMSRPGKQGLQGRGQAQHEIGSAGGYVA